MASRRQRTRQRIASFGAHRRGRTAIGAAIGSRKHRGGLQAAGTDAGPAPAVIALRETNQDALHRGYRLEHV